MSKITLAAYSIQLRLRHTKDYLEFGEVIPSRDFIDFLQDFFNDFQKNASTDTTNKQLFRITTNSIRKNNREFSGIIETGEYGYESKIIDTTSFKSKYKRKTTDAEMLPFYFLTSMPKDRDIGFVLLQRFGLFGISQIFQRNLQKYMEGILPDVIIEFKPILSQDILQKLIRHGQIKKVTFTSFEVPADIAKYYETGKNKTKKGRVEYSLIASRDSSLKLGDRLNKMIFGAGRINKLVQMDRFSYDTTKVVLQNGNDTRTFVIGDDLKFRAYYDLTGKISIGADGHPDFKSIHAEAKTIQKELEVLLYPVKVRNAG